MVQLSLGGATALAQNPIPIRKHVAAAVLWILHLLGTWVVVGAGSVLLYGLGVNAIYGGDYALAGFAQVLAVAWLAGKIVIWEETKRHEARIAIRVLVAIVALAVVTFSIGWIRYSRWSVGIRNRIERLTNTTFSGLT